MALPTGTFSSSFAGTLKVTLTAKFTNSRGDAGFPSSSGYGANMSLQAFAGPVGSPSFTPIIDRYGTTAVLSLDYPGGGALWPVGVSEVSHADPVGASEPWSYGMSDIKLFCELRKR